MKSSVPRVWVVGRDWTVPNALDVSVVAKVALEGIQMVLVASHLIPAARTGLGAYYTNTVGVWNLTILGRLIVTHFFW